MTTLYEVSSNSKPYYRNRKTKPLTAPALLYLTTDNGFFKLSPVFALVNGHLNYLGCRSWDHLFHPF